MEGNDIQDRLRYEKEQMKRGYNRGETVMLKKENESAEKYAFVKMYKDTPISIIKIEPSEKYTIAVGNNIITERRWENVENTERWLETPTAAGEFPWKEIIVIGIITKQ